MGQSVRHRAAMAGSGTIQPGVYSPWSRENKVIYIRISRENGDCFRVIKMSRGNKTKQTPKLVRSGLPYCETLHRSCAESSLAVGAALRAFLSRRTIVSVCRRRRKVGRLFDFRTCGIVFVHILSTWKLLEIPSAVLTVIRRLWNVCLSFFF